MKWQTGLLTLSIAFTVACNTQHSHEPGAGDGATATEQQNHDTADSGLVLNKGEKWKADSLTMLHALTMERIINSALAQSPANHAAAVGQLEAELNKMVMDCTMKGPDHDALHQWLEPMLNMVKAYKQESMASKQDEQLKALQQQAKLFGQYFEN